MRKTSSLSIELAVTPRFDVFYALYTLTSSASTPLDAWKEKALARLPRDFERAAKRVAPLPIFWPLLADAIVEGEVMDPGIVTDAIRSAIEQAGIKSRDVVTAVGGRDVIIKKIPMDRMKESEARELIRWEAEQHVPFDMDNVELDFQILDPEAEGLQMSVLLVAAKRELVETKVSLLKDIGIEPSIIDVDAFALHNAFEINYPDAMKGIVGLVNIGHEITNVNILDEGIPVLTRDLPVGTRRFREDLQRERGLSSDEAHKLLQGFEASDILTPFLLSRGEELAVGVERAAAFLQTSSRSAAGLSRRCPNRQHHVEQPQQDQWKFDQ